MKIVSKYDLVHYSRGRLVSCAVIASGWSIFYLVLILHGLAFSNHVLQSAKLAEATQSKMMN